jgi:hypothetical protein
MVEVDLQDFDKWFNGSRCHNIGFAPRDNVVVADLDSNLIREEASKRFVRSDRIDGDTLHRTRGDVQLVFRCLDLPQWKPRMDAHTTRHRKSGFRDRQRGAFPLRPFECGAAAIGSRSGFVDR